MAGAGRLRAESVADGDGHRTTAGKRPSGARMRSKQGYCKPCPITLPIRSCPCAQQSALLHVVWGTSASFTRNQSQFSANPAHLGLHCRRSRQSPPPLHCRSSLPLLAQLIRGQIGAEPLPLRFHAVK